MPELMRWADIAVAASGSTCWELCASGTPAILTAAAKNQVPIGSDLAMRGISIYLGEAAKGAAITDAVTKLANNFSLREDMSKKGQSLVDGQGACRIVSFLKGESHL